MEDCRRNKINMLSQINCLPDLASLIFGKILYLLKNILSHKSWERKLLVDNDVAHFFMTNYVSKLWDAKTWGVGILNVELLEKSLI